MDQDDWEELNERAHLTIELSVSNALLFNIEHLLAVQSGLDSKNCMPRRLQLAKFIC